jgi:hypothetical protein
MSKSTITKVRRRLRRKRSLMRSQRLFLLPLALVFSILFVLRRYASHSPDPFSVKVYFPGWRTPPVVLDSPIPLDSQQVDTSGPLYMLELGSAKTISNSSMTVVLPVTEKSARTLELTITDLLEYHSTIQEIVILCPESLLSTARSSIRQIITSYGQALSTLLTLIPCSHATCAANALIETAFYVSTDWILFLEDFGLRKVNKAARSLLLNPPAVTFPLGPKGVQVALPKPNSEARIEMCLTPLASHRPADFLVPPFVLPSVTFSDVNALPPDHALDSWAALGRWVSEKRPDAIGGVITSWDMAADSCFEYYSEAQNTDSRQRLSTPPIDDQHSRVYGPEPSFSDAGNYRSQGHFGIFFPFLDDLSGFSQAACALVAGGHLLNIFLYTETDLDQAFISTNTCTLHYHSNPSAITAGLDPGASSWLSRLSDPLDVVITLTAEDERTASLLLAIQDPEYAVSTVVRLPREDLIYSDWMGALSLMEWQSSTRYRSQLWCGADSTSRLECTSR